MKELIWVRVQYSSRQQCCKIHKRPLPFYCSSEFPTSVEWICVDIKENSTAEEREKKRNNEKSIKILNSFCYWGKDCEETLLPCVPRYTKKHFLFEGFQPSPVLSVFAKFRKTALSFIMSVRPPVRMEQLGSHRTDFHEIWYLNIFPKICLENSSFIKIWQ